MRVNKMSDIKIFVSCHKPTFVPNNKLLFPIQVGSALSNYKISDFLHDDEGVNISKKNKMYCELTAQYWAWKNVNADYFGFFHYRRYFSFASNRFPTNYFGDVIFEKINKNTISSIDLTENRMREVIEKYDIIVPEKGRFKEDNLSLYQQYKIAEEHKIEDLDFVLSIIDRDYPEMSKIAKEYIHSTKGYFCNMFIMKKELFNNYCEWLFAILKEHEKSKDFSSYDKNSYRVSGYLGERLFGIYLSYQKSLNKYKICELQRTLFKNTDPILLPNPKFSKNNIAVILSADDYYVPYVSTLLASIKKQSSIKYNYDIIILNRNISNKNQNILIRQVQANNFKLRFFNISSYIKDYLNLYIRGHFKIETYFRLFMPDILPEYHKVLYLDSDIVVLSDIAELYQTDVEGYLLAACKDADTAGLYNGFEKNKKQYMDQILKIKNPYEYFQAGVILFNLDEFRKTYSVKQMMDFSLSYEWELLDQDVLNYLCQGKVKFLDMRWNVLMDWRGIRIHDIIGRAPYYLYDAYMKARQNPNIIHYAGPDKPWNIPYSDFAEYFWKYARESPFYEVLLTRMIASENARHKPAETLTFKKKVKIKLMPIFTFFFPYGSKRRKVVKKAYFYLRGWEC